MLDYLSPQREKLALLTIDAQRDFISGLPFGPCESALDSPPPFILAMQRLVEACRKAGIPIIHAVRLYRCDGSNADLFHRAAIEEGRRFVMPGSCGSELADALKPDPSIRLQTETLLAGRPQTLGPKEWIYYRPRWSAFYESSLKTDLDKMGITSLLIAGCNFPYGPRSTIFAASNRDFRMLVATDAVSGATQSELDELARIGVYLMDSASCLKWLGTPTAEAA